MFKFFKKRADVNEKVKDEGYAKNLSNEELISANNFGSEDYKKKLPPIVDNDELSEEELETVNNFGSEDYKKKLPPIIESDELSEEDLDKMAHDYYRGNEDAYKR